MNSRLGRRGVNPAGAATLTYGVTCMLKAIEELKAEGWEGAG